MLVESCRGGFTVSDKNDSNAFERDRFDAYLKLADYWASRYQLRNEVEWKVGLGLWAVILTGIVSSDKLPRIPYSALWLIGVWLIYVVFWLTPISLAKKQERDLSRQYADEAKALILADKKTPEFKFP